MITIKIKPLSVNEAWQGKRFKTQKYLRYASDVRLLLPPVIDIPDPPLEVHYVFGVSSTLADWDNPIKPFQDILQQKYNFDDKYIHRAVVTKQLVKKGEEFVSFMISKATCSG